MPAPLAEPHWTYQGARCISVSGSRSPGSEPDSFTVEMTALDFRSLKFEAPENLYEDVRGGGPAPSGAVGTSSGGGPSGGGADGDGGVLTGSLRVRGDLVLHDGERSVTFNDMYVRDDGPETKYDVDDEDDPDGNVIRIGLVNVLYFASRRGELWGTYNVIRKAARGRAQRLATAGDVGGLAVGDFEPASLEDGKPVTLLRAIRKVLAAIPGRPGVRSFPTAAAEIVPPDLVWRGISPKAELDRLCETYRLTFALGLDSAAIFTTEDERPPANIDAPPTGARAIGNAVIPAGLYKRRLRVAYRHRPQAVRVVGPRVVRRVEVVRCQPRGHPYVASLGRADESVVTTWEEAAASYRLTLDDIRAWPLLDAREKALILAFRGFEEAAVSEIDAWAYRLFTARDPLLTAKDAAAGLFPAVGDPAPEVEAETFDEVREPVDVEAANAARATLGGGGSLSPVTVDALVALSFTRTVTVFVNKPLGVVEAEVDLERGLVRTRRPVGHVTRPEDLATEAREVAQAAIDQARGRVAGRQGVAKVKNFDARAQAGLFLTPQVLLRFSYEDSARARESIRALGLYPDLPAAERGAGETRYHYSYLAALGTSGKLEHLNPDLVDPAGAETLFPLVVPDETLRLEVGLEPSTGQPTDGGRKAVLDARAREVATQLLSGPDEVRGEEGEAYGFFPIEPSSVISRVEWEAGPGRTITRWSVNNAVAARQRLVAKAVAETLRQAVARRDLLAGEG